MSPTTDALLAATPATWPLAGLASALGLGLLVGLVRERRKPELAVVAGLRTHAVVALAGAVAWGLHVAVFVVLLGGVALFAAMSYRQTREADPGLTGELTLLLTALLGGLALTAPALAGGLGVLLAVLLEAKPVLHRFSREVLSAREVHDGLLLLASALVVLPLLPDVAVDPWGVLRPRAVWRLVVLVMAVGMVGHVALRLVGARWGLPVAGFFSGFVSSTAAVAGFGQRARETPALRTSAVSAALLSNLASLLLLLGVVGSLSPELLRASAWPLGAAAAVLLGGGALGLWRAPVDAASLPTREPTASAFRLGHAVALALAITGVLLGAAWLQDLYGGRGALVAATLAALAEWHAAAASVAQLARGGQLTLEQARLGLVLMLGASVLAKSAVAFVAGSRGYAWRVAAGLLATLLAAVAGLAWAAAIG